MKRVYPGVRLVFVALLAVLFLPVSALAAEAECYIDYLPEQETYFKDSEKITYYSGLGSGFQVTKVTNSKKSIATVKTQTRDGQIELATTPKKVGTTKITLTYVVNGEKKTKSYRIVVKKYVRPCRTFKIGSTNFAPQLKKHMHLWQQKSVSGKLSIKTAKGWKLTRVTLVNKRGKMRTIKNGSKVSLKKGMQIMAYFTKGSLEEEVLIYVA